MIGAKEIKARAQTRQATLARLRLDPRYRRVLGRLVTAKLLTTNDAVVAHRKPLRLKDVLWAGQLEPRILELLPALLLKRPSLFADPQNAPEDLAATVLALRRGRTPEAFRGVAGASLARWVPAVGHKNKRPSQLRSFRFRPDDLALLERLSEALGISQTAVIRRALREVALSR